MPIDPSMDPTVVMDDGDEDATATRPSGATSSARSMLERVLGGETSHSTMMQTFMMTQAVHGQLLDFFITNAATLRVEFT